MILRRQRPRLAPGRWLQVGRIAFLEGTPLTPHLRATVLDRELDGRPIARRTHRVDGQGPCTVAIASGGDEVVLFDPSGPAYLRVREPGAFDQAYLTLRRRFQVHVPGPEFSVRDDGAVVVESLLEGSTLAALAPAEQHAAVCVLLDRFCALVASDVERLTPERLDILPRIHAGIRDALSQARDLAVDEELLAALLEVRTGAPAKGPFLGQNNLLVTDGDLYCIDFPRMAVLPRWCDPATLVVHTAPELLRDERHGARVARLLSAAGIEHDYRGAPAERAALVLATIVVERLKIHRADPAEVAGELGIAAVVDRSVRELRRDWSDLLP